MLAAELHLHGRLLYVLADENPGQLGRHEHTTSVFKRVGAICTHPPPPTSHTSLTFVRIQLSSATTSPVIRCRAQEAESHLKRSNLEIAILPGSLLRSS